ncbi:hypothetical protein FG386_000365 [Cryptosporidium ryanae]|uniref:uncharacterized protein n=1 Tax=Cryptosporidium ryanae TaxID=515981 RepID=UPI00351A6620|nr:hypothetical protein FG386_000365 [Cryptosporidium ryanae]
MSGNRYGEESKYITLISQEGDEFRVKIRLVRHIPILNDEQIRSKAITFDFITSKQMKRVIEYLEFKDDYISCKNKENVNFNVSEEEALDLLIIADKLGL